MGINKKNKNITKKISKQNLLKEILENSETLRELKSLIESFYLIFKEKDLKKFYLWINNVKTSSFSKVHNFTNGLIKDMDAVSNAIKYFLCLNLTYGQCFTSIMNKLINNYVLDNNYNGN